MVFTSLCNIILLYSSRQPISLYSSISSAYRLTKLPLFNCTSATSFMYIKNNKGPSTDPCGTPDKTGVYGDSLPLRTKNCSLLKRYENKQFDICLFMPASEGALYVEQSQMPYSNRRKQCISPFPYLTTETSGVLHQSVQTQLTFLCGIPIVVKQVEQ